MFELRLITLLDLSEIVCPFWWDGYVGGGDIFNDFLFIELAKSDGTSSIDLVSVVGEIIMYIHRVAV